MNDGERQADLDWLYGTNARPTPPPPVVAPRRVAPEPPAAPIGESATSAAPAQHGATQADFDWLYKGDSAAEPIAPIARPIPPPTAPIAWPLVPATAPAEVDDYAYDYDESDDTDYYDDDETPAPTKPTGAKQKGPESTRHKVARRTLTVLLVILALLVSVAGYYVWRVTDTMCAVTSGERCNVGSVISVIGNGLGGNSQNLVPLKTDANGRTNVLLMGTSDDRTDTGGGDWLTDSIIIVSISQTDKNVFMISIPRDLWVKYPTKSCLVGYQGKVNATFTCNGASDKATTNQLRAALIATIPTFEQITGLTIQYAADLNYAVLESLTNAVGGGIIVNLYPSSSKGIYDVNTGLKLAPNTHDCPGLGVDPMVCGIATDKVMALARARASDGGYGLDGGNFSREQNQQAIIVGLLNKAKDNGILTNLAGVDTALQGFGDNLRSTLPADEVPTVVALAQEIPPTSFKSLDFVNATPALLVTADMGGQSALVPAAGLFNYTAIQKWIAKQMSADPAVLEGATIDVLNASGTTGKATTAANALQNLGFTIGKVTTYSIKVTGTQVYDLTNKNPQTSAALAKQYGVSVTTGPPSGYTASSGTDFVVIIGT